MEASSDSPIGPAGLEAPRHSAAVAGIVTANALTLGLALLLDWPVGTLLWPYWLQSLVIGFYARKRILAPTRFSTAGFTVNDRTVDPTPETKRSTAVFIGGTSRLVLVGFTVLKTGADLLMHHVEHRVLARSS